MDAPGPGGSGGGIFNSGQLTIDHSAVTDNHTQAGASQSSLTMSTPGGAAGSGGGIENASGATLTVTASSIAGNSAGAGGDGTAGILGGVSTGGAGGSGGGIENAGTLTVSGSTISGNSAGTGGSGGSGGNALGLPGPSPASGAGGSAGSGGGIDSSTALTVVDSTITGNSTGTGGTPGSGASPGAPGTGGAINETGSKAMLTLDTIADNTAPGASASTTPIVGGLSAVGGGSYRMTGAIVAGNLAGGAPSNCSTVGAVFAVTDNLVFGDNSCGPAASAGDPKLGPLAANGGPTQTMALGAGSAAIDLVSASGCSAATDERGISRPQGAGCDAGAYEVAPPLLSDAAASAAGPTVATLTAMVTPNLRDAQAQIRYGTTPAYGSALTPQNLGASAGSIPLSAQITGLAPGQTYHAQIVVTSADGTVTSPDLTFTTPAAPAPAPIPPASPRSDTSPAGSPPSTQTNTNPTPPLTATVAIAGVKVSGDRVAVTLACAPEGAACSGPLTLTAHVTRRGSRILAVVAGAHRSLAPRTTVVALAHGAYALSPGGTTTVTLTLNAAGRALLAAVRRLPATLSAGTVTRRVVLTAAPQRRRRH